MIASLLLLSIGLTDVARAARSARLRWALSIAVWAVIAVIGVGGLGLAWYAVGACVLLTVGWVLAVRGSDAQSPRRPWPIVILALLVLVGTVADPTAAAASGFLVDAYSSLPLGVLADIDARTAFAGVAVAVFLTRSANLVARSALRRARASDGDAPAARAESWELSIRGRRFASAQRAVSTPPVDQPVLRGGRVIGPIERLLIVALAFTGAQAIIAALVAAKGIVRFPEISADRGTGSKAEEFLVGSLTSWSLSAAAVLYLQVLHAG